MSLLVITVSDILGHLSHQISQFVGSQDLGIRTKAEQHAYQPVVFGRRPTKTEQPFILTKWLDGVAEVGITFQDQNATRCEPDTYFW